MTLEELKNLFNQEIFPAQANDWELDELLENMLELVTEKQQKLMSHVHVVWPVSHNLCFSFLEYGPEYIHRWGHDTLAEWVRQLLGCYEKDGLHKARLLMVETVMNHSGEHLQGVEVRLEKVRGKLLPFIRGVSGLELEIAAANYAWTDTGTIYLPERISYFPAIEDNERFFTYLTCCQWGYIALDLLNTDDDSVVLSDISCLGSEDTVTGSCNIEKFFTYFPDPDLALSIYHYCAYSKVYGLLCSELPGLMRSVRPLLASLVAERRDLEDSVAKSTFSQLLLTMVSDVRGETSSTGNVAVNPCQNATAICQQVVDIYWQLTDTEKKDWQGYYYLTGRIQFAKARERVARRRLEDKQALIKRLSLVIADTIESDQKQKTLKNMSAVETEGGAPLLVKLSHKENDRSSEYTLTVNSSPVALPPELADLLSQMYKDLGHVPEGYVQAAAGIAGQGRISREGSLQNGTAVQNFDDAILYDEWDYRRQGYRKNWCALIEKDIQPVKSRFVDDTLNQYRGILSKLRRQFEMLRTQHRFTRRRRYGDDIDFDALVEAVGDRAAGLAPSERLFIRLLRDERDIAVMFLVDMSNSTEGWVGKAIKESLVLLGDVMEVVGDRYGIYGFSGMRRSRCELFRIKTIDEQYSEKVQQRVCAISPREYTRMAPPLRHLTKMLVDTEARVRLLITISDGKPEDYDDYKGEYAIEDTRQALIEARGKGVIPFCITVDREPQAYLPHMFGEGNYIYVNSVEKLPRRMVEIYRLLTS